MRDTEWEWKMAEVTKKYINEDLSKLCQFFDEVMD